MARIASPKDLRADLARLGLDSERQHLRSWLGSAGLDRGLARRVLRRLSRRGGPEAKALEARLLSLLGDGGASSCFEGLAREGEARFWAWSGEEALVRGNLESSACRLEQAILRDPSYPWAYVYRAALLFRRGDAAGALRDVEAFQGLRPGSPVGEALRAILSAQGGDREEASLWLERGLAKARPGWLLALRGVLRARWGEIEAARRDLDLAVRSEKSPWVHGERADVLNRAGFFWTALRSLERMRKALPGNPEPEARAALIHLDQAQYPQASRRLARAIRMAPGDASLHRLLSQVFFVQGDLGRACAEIEKAWRLAPREAQLQQERLRLMILSGEEASVERLLERESRLSQGCRRYWLGYLRCRQGRFEESQALFAEAEALGQGERACFYRQVARVLSETPQSAPPSGRELLMMGLGYRQPFQASREVLGLMRGCGMFFSNLSDPTVSDLLGLFPVPARTIVFRRSDHQSVACSREVMAGFAKAKRVGVVTRANPVFYGRLAYRLTLECRKRGIALYVPASVSVGDTILSLAQGQSAGGVQIRDAGCLGGLDPRLPVVIYNIPSLSQWSGVRDLLRLYPQNHSCLLLPGSGEREFAPSRVPLSGLRPALERSDPAVTLLLGALEPQGAA